MNVGDHSTTSLTDRGTHLVTLIVNQDHVSQMWLQFLLAVQSALVVALGFLLRVEAPQHVVDLIEVAVPALGVLSAFFLTSVVVYERKWQAWYVQRFNEIPGTPNVFPKDREEPIRVEDQPLGYISRVVVCLGVSLVLGWVSVAVFLLRLGPTGSLPPAVL